MGPAPEVEGEQRPDPTKQDASVADGVGTASSGPKAPPVRQKWSSPIQAMAKIEQEMNGLSQHQKGIVYCWFQATYGPNVVTMAGSGPRLGT